MSFEPEPFTRIIYRWGVPPEYRLALEQSGSLVSNAEYQMVIRGYRKCDVVHIYPETMYEQLKKIESDNLYFIPIRRAKRVSGFAHKFYEPTKPSEVMVYGVVSKNYSDAKKFAEAHSGNVDHKKIGELLGYPECCIDFFCKHFPKGIYDLIPVIEGEYEYPELNIMIRYFGPRAIPFFPCSWSCKEAKKFAEKFLSLMREENEEITELMLELLSMPLRWSLNKSVIQVDHLLFIGVANGFPMEKKVVKIWDSNKDYWGKRLPIHSRWLKYIYST
ncbi:MAG: DUF483 domain-containing protein [Nitrososphaerota archaeon]